MYRTDGYSDCQIFFFKYRLIFTTFLGAAQTFGLVVENTTAETVDASFVAIVHRI